MNIIPINLLEKFIENFPNNLAENFYDLKDAEISNDSFSFYTSVASVFSSKIEGEEIELDSYVKHKRFQIEFKPNYTKKIDDLYDAYSFAKSNILNADNISAIHKLLSKNIVEKRMQGKHRIQNMFITTDDGKIEYVATLPNQVDVEMNKLYDDIKVLIDKKLSFPEVFYFASFIHLIFLKIHPWNDGNGRSARLIEKWFLAEKLGDKAWFVQSEKFYYSNQKQYYNNLRNLGFDYENLDYNNALPFVEMLYKSISPES